jgi:hypothetical protein
MVSRVHAEGVEIESPVVIALATTIKPIDTTPAISIRSTAAP